MLVRQAAKASIASDSFTRTVLTRIAGIAIEASTLMIATTIMISIMVNPDWLRLRISPQRRKHRARKPAPDKPLISIIKQVAAGCKSRSPAGA